LCYTILENNYIIHTFITGNVIQKIMHCNPPRTIIKEADRKESYTKKLQTIPIIQLNKRLLPGMNQHPSKAIVFGDGTLIRRYI